MEQSVLHVEGMSCQHCVKAVTNGVGALAGVAEVVVDLAAKTVSVRYDPAQTSLERIQAEIEDLGYDIAG